jgi:hypothetical protein
MPGSRSAGVLVLSLALIARAAGADRARPTVAVDFASLDERAYKRLDALALEERVVLRLAQEGFAVVARPAEPEILIRLRVLADRVVIEDAAAPAERRREVKTTDEPVRELAHLEIAQKIVELARASRASLPPPAPAPVVAVAAPAPPVEVSSVELAAGGGGLLRPGGTDAQLFVDSRVGPARGPGFRIATLYTTASGGGVSAFEMELQAGAGYRVHLGRWLDLEAALLLGGLLHSYSVDDALAGSSPSGTRLDVLGSLPLLLTAWGPRRSFGFELRIAPGASGRTREHTLEGQTLWRRGALRVETGAALVFHL